MNKIFTRTKLVFLGLFAVAVVAIWGYQYFYVWPGQRCEARGWWWDWRTRICALPVPLEVLTGRKAGEVEKIVPQPQKIPPRPE